MLKAPVSVNSLKLSSVKFFSAKMDDLLEMVDCIVNNTACVQI